MMMGNTPSTMPATSYADMINCAMSTKLCVEDRCVWMITADFPRAGFWARGGDCLVTNIPAFIAKENAIAPRQEAT